MPRKLLPASAAVALALALATWALAGARDGEVRTPAELAAEDAATGAVKSFAALPAGATHYELAGPPDGPVVVLIHGVSGPMAVWDQLAPTLNAAGYRTLRMDLYGRGYSARPAAGPGRYDLDMYRGQVEGLLAWAAVRGRVHLIGSSMGTLVAAAYLRRHPDGVSTLTLIGPAGFKLAASPLAALAGWPGVGELLMTLTGDAVLAAHNRAYFYAPAAFGDFQRRFERQLTVTGSKRAILETLRRVPLQDYAAGFAAVSALGVPTLIVWGRQDRAFPYEHHAELQRAMPAARLVTVEDAGHLPQLEQAGVTGAAVLALLAAPR